MKTRLIILILLALLVLGTTAPAAASGPPWPADVLNHAYGECWEGWLMWDEARMNLSPIIIDGTATFIYDPKTGIWTRTCHLFIDFNNPLIATIDEVCTLFSDITSCSHGVFVYKGFYCGDPDRDLWTTDSVHRVFPSGQSMAVCHFKP